MSVVRKKIIAINAPIKAAKKLPTAPTVGFFERTPATIPPIAQLNKIIQKTSRLLTPSIVILSNRVSKPKSDEPCIPKIIDKIFELLKPKKNADIVTLNVPDLLELLDDTVKNL
jgi:hypothetical protein